MNIVRKQYSEPSNNSCVAENLFGYSINPKENVELNYSSKSLLRYPGGKTRGVSFITQCIPQTETLLSPFFGGGSVELYLAAQGVKVIGYDIFEPLAEFWQCVVNQKDELVNEVKNYYPLSKEEFYLLQKEQSNFSSKIERAAVFYVLNRSSFSGSTLSGGMSPGHPRFTLSSIQRLQDFENPNIIVKKADFTDSLLKHEEILAYLDPPYLTENYLYGAKGSTHKDFNHKKLADILKRRDKWILSYNDCSEIREMYSGYKILTPNWKYGMSNNKESNEVLILSNDINIYGKYLP